MKGTREGRMAALDKLVPTWEPTTVWGAFCRAAYRWPESDFLVFEDGRRYSYREAYGSCVTLAASLRDLGIRPGDHVAVFAATTPQSIFLGLALSGMRVVKAALNPALGSYELAFELRQSQARFLFADRTVDFRGQDPVGCLEFVASMAATPIRHAGWSEGLEIVSWPQTKFGEAYVSASPQVTPLPDLAAGFKRESAALAHEACDIVFTSGSTGDPKGALLSHDSLLRSAYANCLNRGFEEGRRVFVPLPLFHVYAYVEGLLSALFVGGALLMPMGKLTSAEALAFVRSEGANDILAVPSLMMSYLSELEEHPVDFPELHAVYCSASGCPDWIWEAIAERFGVQDVITGYGMTEVSGASLQTHPGDEMAILTQRVGTSLPAGRAGRPIEYRVVDPDTHMVLSQGATGELECRGPIVMLGYCNNPEATRNAFSADGWLRTGDAGRFDERGYLELVGRLKDSYKINGENVSTRFVEKILGRHPSVEAVEVLGVPDDRLGAVGVVFVQLAGDSETKRAEFERYCKQSLARHQVPKYYYFLAAGDWPRTAVGKVAKAELRTMAVVGTKAGA